MKTITEIWKNGRLISSSEYDDGYPDPEQVKEMYNAYVNPPQPISVAPQKKISILAAVKKMLRI